MNVLSSELFVGPAAVVDDDVFVEETTAWLIAKELEDAHYPVLKLQHIPAYEEVRHWEAMSMIILDWNFREESGIEEEVPIYGTSRSSAANIDPERDALAFVEMLLTTLYCPIFIISNVHEDRIWTALEGGKTDHEIEQLHSRVMVRDKVGHPQSILNSLELWVSQNPAIYALMQWQRGYEQAKAALFRDFQRADVRWPGILWRTWEEDRVNMDHILTDVIGRNILHMMDRTTFAKEIIDSPEHEQSMEAVRRVLHQQSVIPEQRLRADVIMPGDFFYVLSDEQDLPKSVEICLTPECNLVPRKGDSDTIPLYVVRADRVDGLDGKDQDAIDKIISKEDSPTSVPLFHLFPKKSMYVVRFKNWSSKMWGDIRDDRKGRLLDPYITLLQQRNSLYAQRKGLPKLPPGYY